MLQLVEKEEEKIAARKDYRTSARTLRKLAESPMIFELDQKRVGDWDRFHIRKIGLRMQGRKFASISSLITDLNGWSTAEKQLLNQIVRDRAAAEETIYLDLMRQHERLRAEIIKLGS